MYKCIGIKALNIAPHTSPQETFRLNPRRPNGIEPQCKACKLKYNKAYKKGELKINSREESLAGRFLTALKNSKETALEVLKQEALITDTDCWEWQKSLASGGYGGFRIARKHLISDLPNLQLVHRWAYWLDKDEYPDETIHHKCANRKCFNPSHLEKATLRDNIGEMFARRSYEVRIKELEKKVIELEQQLTVLKGSK